jgi:hypothetical protein
MQVRRYAGKSFYFFKDRGARVRSLRSRSNRRKASLRSAKRA